MSPGRRRVFKVMVVVAALGLAEVVARVAEWRSAARRTARTRAHYSLEAFTRAGVELTTTPGTIHLVLDPVLGYRLRPSSSVGITVNSRGLRGADVETTPAANTFRVLVVGGSTAFGWGAPSDADTPPALLAAALRERSGGRAVEVLNGGVPGYTAWQEAAWVAELVDELRPDLIVSLTGYNDLEFAFHTGGVGNRVFAQLEQRAAQAFRVVPAALQTFALTRRATRRWFEPTLGNDGPPPTDMPRAAARSFTDALRFMNVLAPGRLLVALQPCYVAHTGRPEAERDRAEPHLGLDEPARAAFRAYAAAALARQRAALQVAAEGGAQSLDLSALFQAHAEPTFTDEVHVTEEGNRMIAEALARAVLAHPAWRATRAEREAH